MNGKANPSDRVFVLDRTPAAEWRIGNVRVMPLSLTITDFKTIGPEAHLDIVVRDRDSGKPINLKFSQRFNPGFPTTAQDVKYFLMRMFEHELDELIHDENGRVNDPHERAE